MGPVEAVMGQTEFSVGTIGKHLQESTGGKVIGDIGLSYAKRALEMMECNGDVEVAKHGKQVMVRRVK